MDRQTDQATQNSLTPLHPGPKTGSTETSKSTTTPKTVPPSKKPTQKNQKSKDSLSDSNYLPVTETELESILVWSATKEQEDKALAEFIKYRSSDNFFLTRPYNQLQDRWVTRLQRYLKFFKGRKSKSTGSKTASGWPITRQKFLLWANRDPRPTIRSITTFLQTIEAARVATHDLFTSHFPELSQQSLPLDPSVVDMLSSFERRLAAASNTANQTTKSTTAKAINSSTPNTGSFIPIAHSNPNPSSSTQKTGPSTTPTTINLKTSRNKASPSATKNNSETVKASSSNTTQATHPINKAASSAGKSSTPNAKHSTNTAKQSITNPSHASQKTDKAINGSTKPAASIPTVSQTPVTLATPANTPAQALPKHFQKSSVAPNGPSASASSLPPKPSFLPDKPAKQKKKKKKASRQRSSSPARHALSQIEPSGRNQPPRLVSRKRPHYNLDSSESEEISHVDLDSSLAPTKLPNFLKQKKPDHVPTKPPEPTRRLSQSSSDAPLALLPAPPSLKKIKTHHIENPPHPNRPLELNKLETSNASIYNQICVFTDTRVPEIRQQLFDALRRDHRNNLSTEQVLEGLMVMITCLTGQEGELRNIGSEEDLKACLANYLDYWANEGIAGFPIGALKLCIWFDSFEPSVTEKETRDICLSFDCLCRQIAAEFPEDEPAPMFDYSLSILHAPLWHSFRDFFGWSSSIELPPDPHPARNPSPSSLTAPSFSTIGSSLSSLPQSPSPFIDPGGDSSEESSSDPQSGPPPHLKLNENLSLPNHQLAPQNHHHQHNNYNHQVELNHENFHLLSYKRDSIDSPHHQQFLLNLHRFLQLLS